MNFGVAANGGIKKKVFAQARAFRQHGFGVDVLFFENQTVKIEGDNAQISHQQPRKWAFLRFLYGGYLNQIDIKQYDFVYVRHFLTNPLFLWMLYRLKKHHPTIKIFMEIPTFPYRFEFGTMPFVKRLELWIDERCTPFFRRWITRIITFSSQPTIFHIPTIRTDNGIDIEQFGLLDKAPFDGQTLHLLGLANVQRWHGLDRFIEGLKAYKGPLKIVFHVVGSGDQIPHLKTLVEQYDLHETVLFHGFLSGDALDAMFKQCHLGIGSCGMHRINVAKGETSALKSREYAARGLPFVVGYEDRGFPENYPFLLQVPADESPIEAQTLIEFYEKVRQTPDYNLQMHQYAKDNLTWKAKMENVVKAFLAQI
ncbi:MAG: glycosyltransferase [Spirosomaceae bacterium]|jgi:glycosyltransferase involved in cell wall biosynthesis|nr:glycosyltransferase [Spirosomataceae bacterium]